MSNNAKLTIGFSHGKNKKTKVEFKAFLDVDIPSEPLVEEYSKKFKEYIVFEYEKNFSKTDTIIKEEILKEVFRGNALNGKMSELNQTIIKATLINNYYQTRINNESLVAIARQIVKLNAKERLQNSIKNKETDYELVNDIAYYRKDINCGKFKFNSAYSFATKYCSWHSHELYPIADSYAKGLLYYLNEWLISKKDHRVFITYPESCDSKHKKTKYINDYKNYILLYKEFKSKFGLKCNKKIDEYLWMYAKKELSEDNVILRCLDKDYSLKMYNENHKNSKKLIIANLIALGSEH